MARIFFRVGVSHVGKAYAEAVVVGTDQGIRSLQVDVVADQDQRALLVIQIDAAGCVGEDDGTNSHAAEDAHGEGDLLRRISFIEMNAALHHGYRSHARFADYHLSGMADGSRAREGGDFVEMDSGGVG